MALVEMEQETIYGTHEDSHVVMSDKVQSLAGSIYQEFEKMIAKYDEEVVKDLMPLVVNVLESLDVSYTENQEHQVELELLREDNEQLVTQYEREKQLRKASEQKLLEIEDLIEDERKERGGKIESLESIVRMLELKAKNSTDHVYRLEEKEQEMKKEYAKLHERYTELFKTHMDYIERTKILMGTSAGSERTANGPLDVRPRVPPGLSLAHTNRSSGPVSLGFQSLEAGPACRGVQSPSGLPASPPDSLGVRSPPSLRNELETMESPEEECGGAGWSETPSGGAASPTTSDDSPSATAPPPPPPIRSTTRSSQFLREQRVGNTLYQELSFQDSEALSEMDEGADITGNWVHPGEYASAVNDSFFGMGKEVENLIMENHELLETKNALNIVKDDLIIKVDELTSEQEILKEELKSLHAVKNRLMARVGELEDELRRTKEELERSTKQTKSDDEEDVPMAQRKRFTRVEMARVLMERNQYKERFMELQEAVRFTEMIRASRQQEDSAADKKAKQSVWGFFSNLFSSSGEKGAVRRPMGAHMSYHSASSHLSPALDTMRKRSLHDRKRGIELSPSSTAPTSDLGDGVYRRGEELRGVRAHVGRREDGRLQAYGWSLPALRPAQAPKPPPPHHVPVPVPVYCRPLMEKDDSMKMWCAAAVNLTGGKTRDGGDIVGASVFYSSESVSPQEPATEAATEVPGPDGPSIEQLEKDIEEGERGLREREEQRLSSLVWICTSTRSVSYVTVIDANNPADLLEVFSVCSSYLLCIASVPGASESDYKDSSSTDAEGEGTTSEGETSEGDYVKVQEVVSEEKEEKTASDEKSDNDNLDNEDSTVEETEKDQSGDDDDVVTRPLGKITFVSCASGSEATAELPPPPPVTLPTSDPHAVVDDNDNELEESPSSQRRLFKTLKEGILKDGVTPLPQENSAALEELEKMSSVLPTMWLGSQAGHIFVHSAVSQWRRCIHTKRLSDAVLSIVHCGGRVVCSLANCTLVVFSRGADAQWDLDRYHLVELGPPAGSAHHSIRCLTAVHSKLWCGFRNNIHVFDPKSMTVQRCVEVHPRKESQVRAMAWLGDGVWVSIRLDSTLRLFHAHTYQHLQDVDIEPYVSKMLGTGKLGFSFARITSLLIACSRLWIGTGNGVIISVPLSDGRASCNTSENEGEVKLYADPDSSSICRATFIPYCSMQHAQLSFHGHRDSVKFFIAVPGVGGASAATAGNRPDGNPVIDNAERPASMLVMSGGEGYVDFRVGDDDAVLGGEGLGRCEPCYLIVWQVTPPPVIASTAAIASVDVPAT